MLLGEQNPFGGSSSRAGALIFAPSSGCEGHGDPAPLFGCWSLARSWKPNLKKKFSLCIFWRRLISRLQVEFPSNWIRVYFYTRIKSGWNRTQWNMLILTEFCTFNILKAKISEQSLSEQKLCHQRTWKKCVFGLLQRELYCIFLSSEFWPVVWESPTFCLQRKRRIAEANLETGEWGWLFANLLFARSYENVITDHQLN